MNMEAQLKRVRFLHLAEHPHCAECRRKGRRVTATAARFISSPRAVAGLAYRVEGLVSLCDVHDRGDRR